MTFFKCWIILKKYAIIPQKIPKMPETFILGQSQFKFSCFFKSYIVHDMDQNDVLAFFPSVPLRSSEHFWRGRGT